MSIAPPDHDPVHSPSHYTSGGIECIDAMRATFHPSEFAAFCKLNAFKYIWRAGKKGSEMEDLEKGQVYLGWALEALDADQPCDEEGPMPPSCDENDCYCPEVGNCIQTIRAMARQRFEEGQARASHVIHGDPAEVYMDDQKVEGLGMRGFTIQFTSDLHPSITDCFSEDCCTDEPASVGSPNEALTESPHPVPDRCCDAAHALAVGLGRLLRSGPHRTRVSP